MLNESILTDEQKDNISNYKYSVVDASITTEYLEPFWLFLQTLIPICIAPNLISISGLIITIFGWALCHNFYNSYPVITGLSSIFCILTYMNLDAIDGIHARKTNNSSSVGELVDHGCDSIGLIFLGLIGCIILEINDYYTIWIIIQSISLVFQYAHMEALYNGAVTFGRFTSPSELLIYLCCVILMRSFGLCDGIFNELSWLVCKYPYIIFLFAIIQNVTYSSLTLLKAEFLIVYAVIFYREINLSNKSIDNGIIIIILDGFLLSVMTIDIIICKMAKEKSMSIWITIMAIISITPMYMITSTIVGMVFIMQNICEISQYMKIPIFTMK